LAPSTPEPSGDLATALNHGMRLLGQNPGMAADQAREILKVVPGSPEALILLGAALRRLSDLTAALDTLEPLVAAHTKFAAAHLELGLTLGALGRSADAISTLRRAANLNPDLTHAWRALGDELTLAGDTAGADAAYARHIKSSVKDPELLEAGAALVDNRLAVAERILRGFLKRHPTDVAAIRMLAEVGSRLGRYEDATNLLARCLELAPGFDAARHNYATVLHRQARSAEALEHIDILLKGDAKNPGIRNLKAAALVQIGEYRQAVDIYRGVLKDFPAQPKAWMSYGHALKTIGRQDDSIAAYQEALRQLPGLGEAYWSLANLKTFRFAEADVTAMQGQLSRTDISEDDRLHLHFALAKALEDDKNFAEAFAHYAEGNKIRRSQIEYDSGKTTARMEASKALFTPRFFAARQGVGCAAPDPIFIVGLPRAGSTLIEQILASHSAVEGTMELPDIIALAKRLGGKREDDQPSLYPDILARLRPEDFKALGEEFIDRTRIHRKLGKPFFIDKMPNNFNHTGFIHLILPRAKIIDARRHPLGCCFSGFKQHFARGQNFSYDLADIGGYYRDYVELMAHFDSLLPGRIHRVSYENMVADMEGETRRLLDYCGLPFEPQCLRFYENERAVRTASSEQVRQPLFTDAVGHWQNFAPWLDPLKVALGPVLATYPLAPAVN
jgi:tetratricopeptide (TPR) repeat protein